MKTTLEMNLYNQNVFELVGRKTMGGGDLTYIPGTAHSPGQIASPTIQS